MYDMDCSGSDNEINYSFLDLLWDDILFLKILPLLPLKELFALRGLSRRSKLLIDSYFQQMKKINLGSYSLVFSIDAFKVGNKETFLYLFLDTWKKGFSLTFVHYVSTPRPLYYTYTLYVVLIQIQEVVKRTVIILVYVGWKNLHNYHFPNFTV